MNKGKDLQRYYKEIVINSLGGVFDKKKGRNAAIFILAGIAYDVLLAGVISLTPKARIVQAVLLLLLEGGYLSLILVFNPFKNRTIKIAVLGQRVLFFGQGMIGIVLSATEKQAGVTKVMVMAYTAISFLQLFGSTTILGVIGIMSKFGKGGLVSIASKSNAKTVNVGEKIEVLETEAARFNEGQNSERFPQNKKKTRRKLSRLEDRLRMRQRSMRLRSQNSLRKSNRKRSKMAIKLNDGDVRPSNFGNGDKGMNPGE